MVAFDVEGVAPHSHEGEEGERELEEDRRDNVDGEGRSRSNSEGSSLYGTC